jgi:hypothetical protein
MTNTELHATIMNIPCSPKQLDLMNDRELTAYKIGHRDARYDAAELVAASGARGEAVSVPDGWKLVPVHPDQIMINAFIAEYERKGSTESAAYLVMLAAAPTPPAQDNARELTDAEAQATLAMLCDRMDAFAKQHNLNADDPTDMLIMAGESMRILQRHLAPQGETNPAGVE